jgi:hypothetical protein
VTQDEDGQDRHDVKVQVEVEVEVKVNAEVEVRGGCSGARRTALILRHQVRGLVLQSCSLAVLQFSGDGVWVRERPCGPEWLLIPRICRRAGEPCHICKVGPNVP